MKEPIAFLIMIVLFALAMWFGAHVQTQEIHRQATKVGVGYFHPVTGGFVWKTNTNTIITP